MINVKDLLDQKIKEEQETRKDRVSSGKWKPSSFGKCFRQQYWIRAKEPESNPIDDRVKRVLRAGQLFHDFVQGLLTDYESEVLIETDDVKGYADIVIADEVIDIKSQHSGAFWHFQNDSKYPITVRKRNDFLQASWYAIQLGKKFVRLVYISKDDLCIAEFVVSMNEIWRQQVDNELKALRYFWDKKELPPAQPRAYMNNKGVSQDCKYCRFKDKCKEKEAK